jgi:hypothetical protein
VTLITGTGKWFTVASALETAVNTGLSTAVDRHGVVPGAIPWDACDCGMLAVSVGRIYLSDTFPEPMESVISPACSAAWEVAEIIFQVIHCAPQPEGQNLYPSVASLMAAAQLMATDGAELIKYASQKLCEMTRDDEIVDHLIGTVDPQGPEGGCVGYQLSVLVALGRG